MLEHTSSAWYLKKSVTVFASPSPVLTPALITTCEEVDRNAYTFTYNVVTL